MSMNKVKITKEDWQSVLRTMEKYDRKDGYVDVINDDFIFFDSDPCIDGCHAMYVTRSDVEQYIEEYDKTE